MNIPNHVAIIMDGQPRGIYPEPPAIKQAPKRLKKF